MAGFKKSHFDIISIVHALPYIPDPIGELRTIKGHLKPDGILFCRVANTKYLLMKNVGILNYLRFGKWSNMNTDTYLVHFTSDTISNALEMAGFKIIRKETGQAWINGSALNIALKKTWHQFSRALKLFGIDMGVCIDIWAVPSPAVSSQNEYRQVAAFQNL